MIRLISILWLVLVMTIPAHALLYTYNKGVIDLSSLEFTSNTGTDNPIDIKYLSAYAFSRSNTNGVAVNNDSNTYIQQEWLPVSAIAEDTSAIFTPGTELMYECYSIMNDHQLYDASRVAGVVLGGAFYSNFTGDLTISFDYTWLTALVSQMDGQSAYTTFRPYVNIRYPSGATSFFKSSVISVNGIDSKNLLQTGTASITASFIDGQFGTFELGINGDIKASDPVPEPSAIILIGFGLVSIVLCKFRK